MVSPFISTTIIVGASLLRAVLALLLKTSTHQAKQHATHNSKAYVLKYESDMMLILLKQRMFNWSPNVPIFISKSMCATHWSS